MKKILLLIATMGLLMGTLSCGNDDEPKRGDGRFTVNTPMINHMYNTVTGELLGIADTYNKLTFDTVKHTASLELRYNDGSDKTLVLSDVTAKPIKQGFYTLTSASDKSFGGYVDLGESSMRYHYTTSDGLRVISTLPEVFFRNTENTVTYDDTTHTTTMASTMYQFTINASRRNATVEVMDIVHAKDLKSFINIKAYSVPVTMTENGYAIGGQNLNTTALYTAWVDSTGSNVATTDKYPFKTFNATIDLVNDRLEATYMIGGSATVTATGTTYRD